MPRDPAAETEVIVNEAEFLEAHTASLSPVARALALDGLADAREAARDRQAQAVKRAAAEERADLLALACSRGGVQPGEIQRLRSLAADADDECRDLADRLAAAEAKRAHVTGNLESLLQQVDEINRAVAARAEPPEDPVGRAVFEARAQAREHAEYLEATRAAWQAVQGGKPGPRPFASRGRAARGEMCPECAAVGASEAESFLIHQDPAPAPVPADFDESQLAEHPYQPDEAEHYRRTGWVESVISR